MESTRKTGNIDTNDTIGTENQANDITENAITTAVTSERTTVVTSENTATVTDTSAWKQWCRLCGKDDPQGNINVFFKDEQMTANLTLSVSIRQYFYIDITEDDDLPKMLCTKCFSLVTSLVNFTELTKKVQDMFSALHNTNTANPAININLREVRLKYGLEDNDGYHMLLNPSLEIHCSDSTTSGLANCAFNKENIENTAHQIKMEAIWIDDYKDEIKDINDDEDVSKNRDCLSESELVVKPDNRRSNDNFDTKDKSELSSETNNEPPKKRLRQSRTLTNYPVAKDNEDIGNENSNVDSSHKDSVEEANLVCTECDRKFRYLSHYDQHMERIHNKKLDNPLPLSSHKKRSDNQTKPCLKFPTTNHRIRRKNNKNESGQNSNEDDAKLARIPKSTVCPVCDKNFTTTTIMQTHMNNIHSGGKNFICEKCGMTSKSMGALKEHILTHTDERPFECKVCNKGFKNKTKLKYHLEIHDAHKHICPKCGLHLNSSKTLHSHLLIHSDQKKFKCDYCGRQFKQGKTLKNHLIIHTGLKPYTCNFCDKTFSFGSSCREHKKRVHPKELAALEAAGEAPKFTTNIPSLELLKAVTKAAVNAKL